MVFEVFYQNKYFHNTDHSCIIGDSFVLSPQCLKYPMVLKYTTFYLLLTENSTIFLELLYLFIPHWKVLLNIKLFLLTILKLQYASIKSQNVLLGQKRANAKLTILFLKEQHHFNFLTTNYTFPIPFLPLFFYPRTLWSFYLIISDSLLHIYFPILCETLLYSFHLKHFQSMPYSHINFKISHISFNSSLMHIPLLCTSYHFNLFPWIRYQPYYCNYMHMYFKKPKPPPKNPKTTITKK